MIGKMGAERKMQPDEPRPENHYNLYQKLGGRFVRLAF
jgi:hypothetical protein